MRLPLILFFLILICASCVEAEKEDGFYDLDFEPESVLVKINGQILTEAMFDFINSFDFEVEVVSNAFYISDLDGSHLDAILQDLNTREYLLNGGWKVTGYLHYQTGQIHVFTRLFDPLDLENQIDWLQAMRQHRLKENFIYDHSGFTIHFKVPEGREKHWARYFRKLSFVNWAELNYYAEIVTFE